MGVVPCPAPNGQWCYIPGELICCSFGNCDEGYTCCGSDSCCSSYQYCGGDGVCSLCSAETVTETFTMTTPSIALVTTTVTEFEEPEEASDFSCFPITITNSENGTLEIDTDCALSYNPPPTSTSTSPTASITAREAMLQARQSGVGSCSSYVTNTEFLTVTAAAVTTSTIEQVITTTQSSDEFSCPTLAVTNSAGDVLNIDASCELSFSPASTSPSASTSTTSRNVAPASRSPGFLLRSVFTIGIVIVLLL